MDSSPRSGSDAPPRLIITDFDGTIVESVEIKTEAFRELFGVYPDRLERIMAYHLSHNGISRFVKFKHIYEEILGIPFDDELRQRVGRRFSEVVFRRVVGCPFVRGAEEFLRRFSSRVPMYLVSASPEDELTRVVAARGLAAHFRGVYGSPETKPDHVRRILAREATAPGEALYVGDSVEDYRVARSLGIPFIGRRNQEDLADVLGPVYRDLAGVAGEIEDRLAGKRSTRGVRPAPGRVS